MTKDDQLRVAVWLLPTLAKYRALLSRKHAVAFETDTLAAEIFSRMPCAAERGTISTLANKVAQRARS
jgi:hypothetical protein